MFQKVLLLLGLWDVDSESYYIVLLDSKESCPLNCHQTSFKDDFKWDCVVEN
jgi:hypothetical protein